MFGSLMRPNSRSCQKVNLNTIARQQKQQGKPSSKYRIVSLDNFKITNPPRKLRHSGHNNQNNQSHHIF